VSALIKTNFAWVSIDEALPAFEVRVLVHSRDAEWTPGVARRVAAPGGGWTWEGDDVEADLEGMQFWAHIPPLPPE